VDEVTIADARYVLGAAMRDGHWTAEARRADTGERFGVACTGENERDALDRLTRWLAWQGEHAAALAALQQAEQAYHRTIAGSAFSRTDEGPSAVELQRESLDHVEAARVRLDEVRARRPN
jgi:hypothetical protein